MLKLIVGKKYKVKIPQLNNGGGRTDSRLTDSRLFVNSEMRDMDDIILTVRKVRNNGKWADVLENGWTWDIHTLVLIHTKPLIGGNIL